MSHTTQSNILFNKLFNEAILSVYRVTQYPLLSTDTECMCLCSSLCKLVGSNLVVALAFMDICVSEVVRMLFRSCLFMFTPTEAGDHIRKTNSYYDK